MKPRESAEHRPAGHPAARTDRTNARLADAAGRRAATLKLWGLDHHRAPTGIREKAHLDAGAVADFLAACAEEPAIVSAVPLCTCNRTEIYVESPMGAGVRDAVARSLAAAGVDIALFEGEYGLRLAGIDAVRHLYRVTAGLESMMLGEPQVSGQVKDAYRTARALGPLGPVTLRAFQGAFRAGKRVRTETKIGEGAVSVAFAAVELARKFFADLGDNRALLVGAGETGALAARHFLAQGIGALNILNRSPERAQRLIEDLAGGETDAPIRARPWRDLGAALSEADVVLTTTGASEPVIGPQMVREAVRLRRGKPLFLLDIAVPRDVHPDAADLEGVYLFGLEDLDEIVQTNLQARRKELDKSDLIVARELGEFTGWMQDMELRPTVAEFRAYLEGLKDREMGYVRKKLPQDVADEVEKSLQIFIKSLLKRPMVQLKSASSREERTQHLDSLRRLFELGRSGEEEPGRAP